MTKLKATLLTVFTVLLLGAPFAGTAHACPDPDNPCDIEPGPSPKQIVCNLTGKYC